MKKILFTLLLVFCQLNAKPLNNFDKRGILVWFYTLEVNKNNNFGNIYKFVQTAGVSYKKYSIHQIAPLSKQSKIIQDKDNNLYLTLAQKKLVINSKRPLFLGQILDITLPSTKYKLLLPKYNVNMSSLKFDKSLQKYLKDRKDLQIHNKKIQTIKNELLLKNPKIYDYIMAVDKFTHKQLHYKKPTRPNSAVDLLTMDNAWCGEFNKLKESLLRAAGIPTRDVYASHYGFSGPSYDYSGSSKVHVWLQSYIPNIGWVSIPSTRKILNNKQLITFRGNYYIRAIELYKYPKEIQSKIYSYKKIDRVGGIRGNGLFIVIDTKIFDKFRSIIHAITDYDTIVSQNIFNKTKELPEQLQPLIYWFLIAIPDKKIYKKSAKLFINSLNRQSNFDFNSFYVVSPTLVKKRIKEALHVTKI